MKAICILLFGFMLTVGQNDESNKVVGHWSGKIPVPGTTQEYPLIFRIAKAKDGALTATMESPKQSSKIFKMDQISFEKGVLKMRIDLAQASYEGVLKDGVIEGIWSQSGQSLELNLTRTKRKGTS